MAELEQGTWRSMGCGDPREEQVGETLRLVGWVQRSRDLGGLIFIDLRDRSGIVQLVFDPERNAEAHNVAQKLRSEFVVAVEGELRKREPDTINPKIATGTVELEPTKVEILSTSKTPPFPIEERVSTDENLRLRYRYLDLRRPNMQRNIMVRHKMTKAVRDFFDDHGFLEIETPMLTRSTPEGARDFLVPSRLAPGNFYALPQSPQIFKQLLMVSGFDRYFQIVRCFRDEDQRADRQVEFTQIDVEMSFVDTDDVMQMVEAMVVEAFGRVGVDLEAPFQRLTYAEAMDRYGSDRPDLRYDLELVEVSDLVAESDFRVFRQAVESGGRVQGLRAPGLSGLSRKELDDLVAEATGRGAKGLAWLALENGGVKSPIAKFFNEGQIAALRERLQAEDGDLLLFVADQPRVVADALGHLRQVIAARLGLGQERQYRLCWVTDFPLLEYDEEDKRWTAMHHPFTSPRDEDLPLLETDPGKVRAKAYDLVMDGVELGGGSIRIHRSDVQARMFRALGLSEEEAKDKFGFLLEAFEYGPPPHGGIAFGLDRMVAMVCGDAAAIREVIAFPKTSSGMDLMMGAPSGVDQRQLRDLHIKTNL